MATLTPLIWNPNETPAEISGLLEKLSEEYPIQRSGAGQRVAFCRVESSDSVVKVQRTGEGSVITYSTLPGAARGVGAVLSGIRECDESTPFRMLGIMLDVSRGMVMKPEHLKMWFRRLSLMGCSLVMLYCEDTYKMPGEPLFGYMRGGYSLEELQDLDRYAASVGIELCGCIQTLGHLEQALKWPWYAKIADQKNILLVDEEESYALIDKMLAFWSKALSTRRIHLGMDETQGLGMGNFAKKHGLERGFDIVNRHLNRVNDMCGKYGLHPMIWGDMYFRYGNKSGRYYDLESDIPQDVADAIPKGVQLVYWDYYNDNEAMFCGMIEKYRKMGCEPVMGSGVWSWAQPWYNHEITSRTVVPCLNACRKEKIRDLFFTMWGDDGGYCNYDSCLAGLCFAMDRAYGMADDGLTAQRFDAICRSDYRATLNVNKIYEPVPGVSYPLYQTWLNPAVLLWDDPLVALMFDQCRRDNPEFALILIARCEKLIAETTPYVDVNGAGNFKYAVALLNALKWKLRCRQEFEVAYEQKDMQKLRSLLQEVLPQAISSMQTFAELFREQWLATSKPFSLEVIQIRYAGQIERLRELGRRIELALQTGKLDFPEMEERLSAETGITHQVQVVRYTGVCSAYTIFP